MSKVLVIGAGFLGRKLVEVFSKNGFKVEATSLRKKLNKIVFTISAEDGGIEEPLPANLPFSLDITGKKAVEEFFKKSKPEIVILAASLTNVDYCEEHPEEAEKINVEGTKNVIEECKKSNSKLVFYSTDFVFDGEKGNYSEIDKTKPLCVYAKTKLEGEKLIEKNLQKENFLILRTSTLYGFGIDFDKKPFTDWVIESLKSGKKINAVFDQITCPTLIDDLANATLKLVQKKKCGLYHAVGSEAISRFDFAKKIAKIFGLDESLINEIKSSELFQKAKRPKDSSLGISKLENEGIEMSNVEQGLKEMKRQMCCLSK